MRRRRNDRGAVTAYVAIISFAMFFVIGLIVDGGSQIATYNQASDLAGRAARAAAQGVDPGPLYASGRVVLDQADATARARAYLLRDAADSHPGTTIQRIVVRTNGNSVTVTVQLSFRSKMLPGGPRSISATETATALRGVETGR